MQCIGLDGMGCVVKLQCKWKFCNGTGTRASDKNKYKNRNKDNNKKKAYLLCFVSDDGMGEVHSVQPRHV